MFGYPQSCKTCSNFLRVKFKISNLPQNMAFSNSNIYKFKTIQSLKSPSYWLIPIFYWPVFGIDQLVDCIVRLTFVPTAECSTTKPSSLTSHTVNLPHGWYPRVPAAFLQLWLPSNKRILYFRLVKLPVCVLFLLCKYYKRQKRHLIASLSWNAGILQSVLTPTFIPPRSHIFQKGMP